MSLRSLPWIALSSLCLLASCADDPATESAPRLSGTVSSGALTDLPPLQVFVAWESEDDDLPGDTAFGQSVAITGDLPASFALALSEPPPASMLWTYPGGKGDVPFALGYIVSNAVGADVIDDDERYITPLGISLDYMVAWVDADVQPGTWTHGRLGAPLTRGFHLMKVTDSEAFIAAHPDSSRCAEIDFDCPDVDEDTPAGLQCANERRVAAGCLGPETHFDQLSPAPDGFATAITIALSDAPETLDSPDPH